VSTYRQADGTFASSGAIYAGGGTDPASRARAVAIAWYKVERDIPTSWAVGVSLHEGNYAINIRDIEPNGHTTGGVFEVDLPTLSPYPEIGDAARVKMPWLNPFDLDDCCKIFAARSRSNLLRIVAAANKWNAAKGLPLIASNPPPPDVYSYMAIAHNQGLGAALLSIQTYGMDWAAYKARPENANVNVAIDRGSGIYGDDVVSGGVDFTSDMLAPFDASGAVIPPPVIDAFVQSQLMLVALLGLLALVVYFFVIVKTPLKGTI
jgi:hypothetical protein